MWSTPPFFHFTDVLATSNLLLSTAVIGLITYILYKVYLSNYYFSPLWNLPGDKPSWNGMGTAMEMRAQEVGEVNLRNAKKYGPIYRYYTFWNQPMVAINDAKLIQQVLVVNAYDYDKGPEARRQLGRITGKGLVFLEGDQHKRQRKAINPAFAHKYIKTMVPTFFRLAKQLSDIWDRQLKPNHEATEFSNVLGDLSKATLDIIGLAGFGEEFGGLSSKSSHISQTYSILSEPRLTASIWEALLYTLLPWDTFVRVSSKQTREIAQAMKRIKELTWELVQKKKSELLEEENKGNVIEEENLLRVLLKMGGEEDGLTDKELQAQVMTFLAAGHDTTAVALTWGLWLLARHPETQKKLREEVTPLFKDALDNETIPSYDNIDALKYLNAVCKEGLRIIPPVPGILRQPLKDIELGGYLIPKGTNIVIPISAIHRLPRIWGEDAEKFKPERWFGEATEIGPHEFLPFLVGPRHCIGYKFALMEMKIVLGFLVTRFEFAEVPGFQVLRKAHITCKPSPEMRLLVRRV